MIMWYSWILNGCVLNLIVSFYCRIGGKGSYRAYPESTWWAETADSCIRSTTGGGRVLLVVCFSIFVFWFYCNYIHFFIGSKTKFGFIPSNFKGNNRFLQWPQLSCIKGLDCSSGKSSQKNPPVGWFWEDV